MLKKEGDRMPHRHSLKPHTTWRHPSTKKNQLRWTTCTNQSNVKHSALFKTRQEKPTTMRGNWIATKVASEKPFLTREFCANHSCATTWAETNKTKTTRVGIQPRNNTADWTRLSLTRGMMCSKVHTIFANT